MSVPGQSMAFFDPQAISPSKPVNRVCSRGTPCFVDDVGISLSSFYRFIIYDSLYVQRRANTQFSPMAAPTFSLTHTVSDGDIPTMPALRLFEPALCAETNSSTTDDSPAAHLSVAIDPPMTVSCAHELSDSELADDWDDWDDWDSESDAGSDAKVLFAELGKFLHDMERADPALYMATVRAVDPSHSVVLAWLVVSRDRPKSC